MNREHYVQFGECVHGNASCLLINSFEVLLETYEIRVRI